MRWGTALTRWISLAVVLLCGLGGCDTPQTKIVGKWQVKGADLTWEFYANGTVTTGTRKGKWTFGESKRLKIETGIATFMYDVEFPTRDHMIWKDRSGPRTELRRLP